MQEARRQQSESRRVYASMSDEMRADFNKDFSNMKDAPEGEKGILPGFECVNYPHKSKSSAPTCKKTCKTCKAHYRPLQWQYHVGPHYVYGRKYSDDEAATITREAVKATRENYDYIRSQIKEFGDAILKRWTKRNKPRRADAITSVMPDIHKKRWARAEVSRECLRHNFNVEFISQHRKTILLPYLSQESLSEDLMELLQLLHCRTSYHPTEWVMFDSQQLDSPFEEGLIQPSFNPHCVIMYGDQFGELTQWSEEAAHSWNTIGFPRAQLILEAQLLLSKFLRGMVDQILHETQDARKGCIEWDNLVANGFSEGTACVAKSPYLNQAIFAPMTFSISHMLEILTSRRSALEDEIWLAQTDPSYAYRKFRSIKHESCFRFESDEHNYMYTVSVLLHQISRLDLWTLQIIEALRVREVLEKHDYVPVPGNTMPEKVSDAIQDFACMIKLHFDADRGIMQNTVLRTQSFKDSLSSGSSNIPKPLEDMWVKDKLLWTLREITFHCDPLEQNLAFHFGILEDILSEKKERSRISHFMYQSLADIAALDECQAAMKLQRPRYGTQLGLEEAFERAKSSRIAVLLSRRAAAINDDSQDDCEVLIKPLKAFLDAREPSSKATKSDLEYFDDTYRALSEFWARVRSYVRTKLKRASFNEEDMDDWMEILSADQTQEFKKGMEHERNTILHKMESDEADKIQKSMSRLIVQPPTTVQKVWGNATNETARPSVMTAKTKVKSRPETSADASADANAAVLIDEGVTVDERSPKETIPVTNDSLIFFKRMFIESAAQNRSAKWDQLVAAMVDAGCSAMHNGGSAVNFRDVKHGSGSIVFHRPHGPFIDPVMLQSMGKRLSKRLRWDYETFVLRAKNGR